MDGDDDENLLEGIEKIPEICVAMSENVAKSQQFNRSRSEARSFFNKKYQESYHLPLQSVSLPKSLRKSHQNFSTWRNRADRQGGSA